MTDYPENDQPALDGLEPDDFADYRVAPPKVVNWNDLTAEEAEHEWLTLNRWVHWLRTTYALPPAIIPPLWHRHWELVWELSALHTHWLGAYHPDQHGSAPIGWHADFALARDRFREWVATAGTKLDRDRPTRQAVWPGETESDDRAETLVTDREADFVEWVHKDVSRRMEADDSAPEPE